MDSSITQIITLTPKSTFTIISSLSLLNLMFVEKWSKKNYSKSWKLNGLNKKIKPNMKTK